MKKKARSFKKDGKTLKNLKIELRLSQQEYDDLVQYCQESGRSMANVLRKDGLENILTYDRKKIKKIIKMAEDMPDPFDSGDRSGYVDAMFKTVDESDRKLAEEYQAIEDRYKKGDLDR